MHRVFQFGERGGLAAIGVVRTARKADDDDVWFWFRGRHLMSRQKLLRGSRNNGGMGKCKKIPKFTRASIPLPVTDARSFSKGSFWARRTLFCDDDDVIESISVHTKRLGVWHKKNTNRHLKQIVNDPYTQTRDQMTIRNGKKDDAIQKYASKSSDTTKRNRSNVSLPVELKLTWSRSRSLSPTPSRSPSILAHSQDIRFRAHIPNTSNTRSDHFLQH